MPPSAEMHFMDLLWFLVIFSDNVLKRASLFSFNTEKGNPPINMVKCALEIS